MKKKIEREIKRIKKIVLKSPIKSGIILGSILVFIALFIMMGLIRALLFTALIDLLIYGFFYLNKKKTGKNKRKKLIKKILIGVFSLGIITLLSIMLFIVYIVISAPKFDPTNMDRQESTLVYDSKGEIIAKLGTEKREKITYDEMPEVLVDAIIATEDSRFFQHNGFDLPRFVKAAFGQALGQDSGGASTLTMQVSKNNYTSTTASGFEGIKRKFTDIYLSIFVIEKNYTKKEILEFYVNQPYLGSGTYGVEQACQTYFGKSAKDINLSEAAIIAGLFQAPNKYDPYASPAETAKRRSTVLYLMERHGYITSEERKAANAITVESLLSKTSAGGEYQAFIDTVVEDVIKKTGEDPYLTSMQIYTTMDKDKQTYINNIMNGVTFTWENAFINTGIAVVDVKTGAVVAVGAGRNRVGQRQFNTATMIKRQIGSTAKPFYDYGPGMEFNNWSTYTPFVDEPHGYTGGMNIQNWDGKYMGFMTSRKALSMSRNIPALKAFQSNVNKNVKGFVTSLGLHPEIDGGVIHEAHALGGYNGESPMTMASAYAAFANGGNYTEPYTFTKIIYRKTEAIFEYKPKVTVAMSTATAYMISDILIDAAKHAVGTSSINGATFGAKTGTTNFTAETVKAFKLSNQAINDLWIDAISTDYAVSIWYGYEKINPDYYTKVTNFNHIKLFKKLAPGIFKNTPGFTKPNDVMEVNVETETNPAMLPSANTPSNFILKELFKEGTEPTEVSKRFDYLDNVTNLTNTISGNKITLSWNGIKTPAALDTALLNPYFTSLYQNNSYRTSAFNARINYNNINMGEVGYNIYSKDSAGALSPLGFTKGTTYEYTAVGAATKVTLVVKSTYTIFKPSESTGVSLDIAVTGVANNITSKLNGLATMPLSIDKNEKYVELGVKVEEDGVDVTSKATVVITGANLINPSIAASYNVIYTISYKNYSEILTRIVVVS